MRPSIRLHDSGLELPSIVVVDMVVGCISFFVMPSFVRVEGSRMVQLAWSSSIANPSTERLDLGCVRMTGHVLLYEDTLKTLSRPLSWRPVDGCQSIVLLDTRSSGRHPRAS